MIVGKLLKMYPKSIQQVFDNFPACIQLCHYNYINIYTSIY